MYLQDMKFICNTVKKATLFTPVTSFILFSLTIIQPLSNLLLYLYKQINDC